MPVLRALRSVSFGNTGVTLYEGQAAEVKNLSAALNRALRQGWFEVVEPNPNIKALDLTAMLKARAKMRPPPPSFEMVGERLTAWERIMGEENF